MQHLLTASCVMNVLPARAPPRLAARASALDCAVDVLELAPAQALYMVRLRTPKHGRLSHGSPPPLHALVGQTDRRYDSP